MRYKRYKVNRNKVKLQRNKKFFNGVLRENKRLLHQLVKIDKRPMEFSVNSIAQNSIPLQSSLKGKKRLSNLKRITRENHWFLNRLRNTTSVYNVLGWENDHANRKSNTTGSLGRKSFGTSMQRGNLIHR
ncbi:unnamed protein product [Moneuplotes crassus]|uniref:Uncharacterized protein n=1 Tax=Euplotes crassus TaxID=5936 RepID=A0AAD1XQG4_EUPCR|nr:unnamed protein product [Moneuplotes crassus]